MTKTATQTLTFTGHALPADTYPCDWCDAPAAWAVKQDGTTYWPDHTCSGHLSLWSAAELTLSS